MLLGSTRSLMDLRLPFQQWLTISLKREIWQLVLPYAQPMSKESIRLSLLISLAGPCA